MGNPFKDQFLKKGLVTKKQVNKASHDQRLATHKKGNTKDQEEGGAASRARQAIQEQAARDRELNRQQQEATREKEIQSQIRQIITQNKIEAKGDLPYHFADEKKIQKLYVSKTMVEALSKGLMAIVKQDERYVIVPAKAGLQIQERRSESLLLLNSPVPKPLAPDDPYAEFPIPDDYDW